ncbi:hypothetical protein CHLNCDRAFT_143613 [Chlorella variabilis]|uniref:Kazal-like domain-containing protein n=1 Tax=Chlorella variabilis TaxID=554065 RepID=E1ZA39_CHLVA|nr:hypothetical protein CHLNCDRAFT_143613 [Chlorella variabilis]EFN56990.1 hypothetical protein CHLNCDRAFT_143613 [Chlorella variabilis]|eukprot:XP_005849092.1 hypothetical protein CHLNCDRAFT_143613 [Chlorella variabilis]
MRTLKGFATGAIYGVPLAFRLAYIEHYNDLYFMDAAVEEALALAPATTSAQASRAARAGAFPWHARRREAGRMLCHAAPALVLKLIPQHLMLVNYMMHEVEAGLNKTQSKAENNTDLARGAPHNLDEGWGLYVGTGSCGIYPFVNAMSSAFGVTGDSADGKTCESPVHRNILAAFKTMYGAATKGNLAAFKQGRNALAKFILATLKAAAEVSKRVGLKQSAATPLAQGYGYWRAIEAVVAATDQAAADAVLAALQSAYPKLSLNPALVGTVGAKRYLKCNGTRQALDRCLARCPKAPKKVCGFNGKTYPSKCAALCYGTTVRKAGAC